jgi:hypothetical protein
MAPKFSYVSIFEAKDTTMAIETLAYTWKRQWAVQDLNLRPLACHASALPDCANGP